MTWRDTAWPLLLVLAGAGLWLLFVPGERWGIDYGMPGALLLLAGSWLALWIGASRQQRASGEWIAWAGLCVSLAGLGYFVLRWPELMAGTGVHARWVMANLMLLLIGWALLLQGWAGRWTSPDDPSARPWAASWHQHPHGAQIEREAAESGRMALTFGLVCLALLFGFLPETRLTWVRPFLVANLLLFVLLWGWLVEYVMTLWLYRRYRRAARIEPEAVT